MATATSVNPTQTKWVKVGSAKPTQRNNQILFDEDRFEQYFSQKINKSVDFMVETLNKACFKNYVRNIPVYGKLWFIEQVNRLYSNDVASQWLHDNYELVDALVFTYRGNLEKRFKRLSKRIGSVDAQRIVYKKPPITSITGDDFVSELSKII